MRKLREKPWATSALKASVAADSRPREIFCIHIDDWALLSSGVPGDRRIHGALAASPRTHFRKLLVTIRGQEPTMYGLSVPDCGCVGAPPAVAVKSAEVSDAGR